MVWGFGIRFAFTGDEEVESRERTFGRSSFARRSRGSLRTSPGEEALGIPASSIPLRSRRGADDQSRPRDRTGHLPGLGAPEDGQGARRCCSWSWQVYVGAPARRRGPHRRSRTATPHPLRDAQSLQGRARLGSAGMALEHAPRSARSGGDTLGQARFLGRCLARTPGWFRTQVPAVCELGPIGGSRKNSTAIESRTRSRTHEESPADSTGHPCSDPRARRGCEPPGIHT